MLNDWLEANTKLGALNCDLGESHPSFKYCPRSKKGFLVLLDRYGHVEDVDIPGFGLETIRRWQEGNMDPSFPVISGRAFYEVNCEPEEVPIFIQKALGIKKAKDENELKLELQDFLNRCDDLWEEELEFIDRCLHELPIKLVGMLNDADAKPGGYGAYKELTRRAGLCQPKEFRNELREILIQKLHMTSTKEFAEVLFVFKNKVKKKGRGREHGRDFLFLLSIKDWNENVYGEDRFPPYHDHIQKWMSRIFEQHSNKAYKSLGKNDAFGLDIAGAEEKYNDVNAADIGQIKLFAAYDKIPCLMRYRLESVNLFPAGHKARELARKTLEYILDRNRKGKTWISLRKYENRGSLAFAYCTKLGNIDNDPIKIFDIDDDDGKESIYISEEATKTALKTLEGISDCEPGAEIFIGIIAQVDKGNTKALASRHYPLQYYISGAIDWQHGCTNIPEVAIPRFVKNGKAFNGALPIYPIRAIWLLNSAWRQNGELTTRKKEPISKRFASSDALDLLFEKGDKIHVQVDTALENILDKSKNALIMARLKAELDKIGKGNKVDFKDSEYLHMLPTLYGLLLFKKGIRKEDYMKEDVFYLGKFLAVVDKLYIQYSLDVRNGDVPLRLLGNDHVSLALQNPLEAFLALSRRLEHPYISWAKRVRPDTIPRQAAKNCLKDIAELTYKLAENRIPNEIDDDGKAKLILGYLSYNAKEENEEDHEIEPQNNKEGETNG